MRALRFTPVEDGEQQRVLETLVLAFTADPVIRWLYPEARQYLKDFPGFLAAFGGKAFAERTVWRLGAFAAVALWLPPRVELDGDAVVEVLTETVVPEQHDDTFSVWDRWTTPIQGSRTGISRGSASTPPCRDGASVAN